MGGCASGPALGGVLAPPYKCAMIDSLTPLIAIDAVALDTETTGADVRTSSVIEIGAVRIISGVLRPEQSYRSLVRPGGRIDPEAIRVHGIDDLQVGEAPLFQEVWPQVVKFAGESVMIGHTIGFDLAVLERQLATCGLTWRRPRMLDTQLLAQLASPELGKCSLDTLVERFAIAPEARHSALGDATLAAKVFLALLPQLQRINIRTLGEAETACRSLTQSLDAYWRASWVEPIAPPAAPPSVTRSRRDLYAYRHRVADVMSAPPRFVRPDLTLDDALSQLLEQQISSVFVAADVNVPRADQTGILTERDVLRAFSVHGSGAREMRVGELMSRPLVAVPADAFAYLAIARMRRLRIRHLGVVDEASAIVGAVSARDLLRLHGEPAVLVGDEVDQAESVQSLSKAWAKLHLAVASMISDVTARELASLISQVLGEVTARAAVLAERALVERGLGPPPCAYVVVVLGSAGRGESLLAVDQDNALVFLRGDPDGLEDRWFAALGSQMADILHTAGIPYCPGGVMARNAAWRGSVSTWEHRIDGWISRSSPKDLLSVDIFFDMKPVHGDAPLALALWRGAFDRAHDNAGFAKLLVEASAAHAARALSWFGTVKTVNGRIDLKRTGTFGLVTAARALAIRHHVVERSTFARFAGVDAKGLGHEIDFGRFAQALDLFLAMILKQQVEDIGQGLQPGNSVAMQGLSRYEREQLREALAAVEHVSDFVRDLLF
jgi:DNA polymerase-3 subunit epsilon/CBS domain-containing protein